MRLILLLASMGTNVPQDSNSNRNCQITKEKIINTIDTLRQESKRGDLQSRAGLEELNKFANNNSYRTENQQAINILNSEKIVDVHGHLTSCAKFVLKKNNLN